MRPKIIETPEQFDTLVDLYVLECAENKRPLSIVGMALYLGLSGKGSFYEYSNYPEFTDSVERAKSLVEQQYLDRTTMGQAERGNIFLLKAVYKYKDQQQVEVQPITIKIEGKDSLL